ncbi:hypothetical protein BCR44DRAFT_1502858 [Catenaria anguillulae PL171]|uniref:Quinon protein alcohol dehydrogenase-like superfamily n=1 Tax=Catenaria anguillulae PL171 TaxID=765915 RepID=A0A1Y2HA32_9FUNG|nr:hypothetical protein BCR44DRAFT_1502858 [Catenaria anguillulae PL171]
MDFNVPIHCIATVPRPHPSADKNADLIFVGGGGGPGNTGLVNQLAQLEWSDHASAGANPTELHVAATATFSKNDDAPWSIAVSPDAGLVAAGVNAPASDEFNRNCRILARSTADTAASAKSGGSTTSRAVVELKEIKAFVTTAKDKGAAGDYQCAAAFSPDGKYLATGSDAGTLSLLKAPSFVQFDWSPLPIGSKIFNLDFSRDSAKVIVTAERALRVYKVESGELLLEVKPPAAHTFRAGRPGPGSLFYTLVNQRRIKCILSVWDLDRPDKPVKSVTVASKPAVSFAIRDDIAAIGLADCSLLLLHSLHHARTLPNVHDVPITALAIARQPSPTTTTTSSPSSSSSSLVILSASGDGKIKVWPAPKPSALHQLLPAMAHSPIVVALVALLLAAWFTWLVLGVIVPADELVKAGIPFVSVQGGAPKLVVTHVEWMRNVGLDRVFGH